jgi:dTDP-L-rhamnose 4-epimerase
VSFDTSISRERKEQTFTSQRCANIKVRECYMKKRILLTGGAGFIGSHVTELLLSSGCDVRILDNLAPQVHGPDARRPAHLSPDAELLIGDVRDPGEVEKALRNVDGVIHLAASVGVGQSMYDITSYVEVNEVGTAVLLQALSKRPVQRLVVASSMSVYGEGLAQRPDGTLVVPEARTVDQLGRGAWDLGDSSGQPLSPVATPETKQPSLSSVYALNKYAQEQMALIVGRAYGMDTVALRFFNVYGPRQALSNPYTGVLAIFASRLLNKRPPLVFEDGMQRRDFVQVHDVSLAVKLALETEVGVGCVYNVGSGQSRSILSIAEDLARIVGLPQIVPHVPGRYRAGDIRHCFADISLSQRELGFVPEISFEEGLTELAEWLSEQVAHDQIDHATAELERRGLVA